MQLEVKCKESQASTWIIASFNRRYVNHDQFHDDFDAICEEVASELKMNFELKQDGTLLFQDKIQ